MSKQKKKDPTLEHTHGHAADLLMSDYGIPEKMRYVVCEEIDKIYEQISLIHCEIIHAVRGWGPLPQTDELKRFLEAHATHPPKHHKKSQAA